MKRFNPTYLTLLLTAAALFALAPSGFPQTGTGSRNLSEYARGPFVGRADADPMGERDAEMAPARKFLWQLWTGRTKGFVGVTFYSREGESTRCRFFVEPGPEGRWQVVSECESRVCPYTSGERCRKYLRDGVVDTYDVVERFGYEDTEVASMKLKQPRRKLPGEEPAAPRDFVLRLTARASGKTQDL